jgi:aminopeptidase-like protein
MKSMGEQMYKLIGEMFPICRSITGKGVTDTLNIIAKHIPLTIHQVPSGTKVFDWEIPLEWNIRGAYIMDSKGNKVVDFANNNLHVLNYSVPVHRNVTIGELREHLYTLPETPDWIPYRTSYYKEQWGFCVSHNQYRSLKDDRYEIHIDSSLEHGNLTYAECFIPGRLKEEVLISTHICHPSLCNDNLSGIAVATFLAKELLQKQPRYSYRFVFVPGTIGAIAWLAANEKNVMKIKHGLVASLLGDGGAFVYKKSRRGNTEIDEIVSSVLRSKYVNHKVIDFNPFGYDERQYCSPGFNLPVGCLSRSLPGQYPEYHTSADNLDLVRPESLQESLELFSDIVRILEANQKYVNQNPRCEPLLSKRNLYHTIGGTMNKEGLHQALLWTLNLADGGHTVMEISRRSGVDLDLIIQACNVLHEAGLLAEVEPMNELLTADIRSRE